jgi:hypothetical protein
MRSPDTIEERQDTSFGLASELEAVQAHLVTRHLPLHRGRGVVVVQSEGERGDGGKIEPSISLTPVLHQGDVGMGASCGLHGSSIRTGWREV